MQWLVPPVGFAGRRELVWAVGHEVAEVFPDFGDVLYTGFGGFVAVDPQAVFLVEGSVFPARGEGEGIAGAERGAAEFGAFEKAASGIAPFKN